MVHTPSHPSRMLQPRGLSLIFWAAGLLPCALSCGGKGGWGNSGTPQDPLLQLTDEQRGQLETWKGSLVKSCDVSSIFKAEAPRDSVGLDGRRVLEITGKRLVLGSEGGGFVVFGQPKGLVGEFSSSLSTSTSTSLSTLGGSSQASSSLNAGTRRAGSKCSVEVGGQTVYETEIWGGLPMVLSSSGSVAQPAVTQTSFVADSGIGNSGVLLRHGFAEAILAQTQASMASESVQNLVASTFPTLSPEQRKELFPPQDEVPNLSLILRDGDSALVINRDLAAISGSDALRQALAAPTGELSLDLVLRPTAVAVAGLANDADAGTRTLFVRLTWETPEGATSPGARVLRVPSLALGPRADDSPQRFDSCTATRHAAFVNTAVFGSGALAPSYDGTIGPCGIFVSDLEGAIDANEGLRTRLSAQLAGIQGGTGQRYNGWDAAIRTWATRAAVRGEDIQQRLDPERRSPLILALAGYVQLIGPTVATNAALRNDLETLISRFACSWSFAGQNVGAAHIDRILAALANTRAVLPASTDRLIDDLSNLPSTPANDAAVTFALGFPQESKDRVGSLRNKAIAADLGSKIESSKLAGVLQDEISTATLDTWIASVDNLVAFRTRDLPRANASEQWRAERDLNALTDRALAEDWTAGDWQTLEALGAVAVYQSTCASYATASARVSCVGLQTLTKKSGGLLDPAFGTRYRDLAVKLGQKLGRLSDFSDNFIRRDIVLALYRPMWTQADGPTFEQNSTQLIDLINLRADASFSERFDLERKIKSLIAP